MPLHQAIEVEVPQSNFHIALHHASVSERNEGQHVLTIRVSSMVESSQKSSNIARSSTGDRTSGRSISARTFTTLTPAWIKYKQQWFVSKERESPGTVHTWPAHKVAIYSLVKWVSAYFREFSGFQAGWKWVKPMVAIWTLFDRNYNGFKMVSKYRN